MHNVSVTCFLEVEGRSMEAAGVTLQQSAEAPCPAILLPPAGRHLWNAAVTLLTTEIHGMAASMIDDFFIRTHPLHETRSLNFRHCKSKAYKYP
jgi:hypothetical protein